MDFPGLPESMKSSLCRLLSVLSLFWMAASAFAVDVPAEIPVLIPVEQGPNEFPLPPQPIVPALVKLLAAESGLNLVARPMPWRRAQSMAENGEGLLYGAAPTPERVRMFQFTEAIGSVRQWLVSTSRAPIAFRQWEDLRGKEISILSGAKYGAEFERRRGQLFSVQENSPTIGSRLAMLRAGRVDAVLIASYLDAAGLEAKLNCMFPQDVRLVVAGVPVDTEPLMIAVPRLPPLDRRFSTLNEAIVRLAASERLQAVRDLKPVGTNCR